VTISTASHRATTEALAQLRAENKELRERMAEAEWLMENNEDVGMNTDEWYRRRDAFLRRE
tara:strand:+ start:1027 stop:1209 length:183 start_codon:yes stop_codon:yes gene_type:complete